jgi:hypothetical protein
MKVEPKSKKSQEHMQHISEKTKKASNSLETVEVERELARARVPRIWETAKGYVLAAGRPLALV